MRGSMALSTCSRLRTCTRERTQAVARRRLDIAAKSGWCVNCKRSRNTPLRFSPKDRRIGRETGRTETWGGLEREAIEAVHLVDPEHTHTNTHTHTNEHTHEPTHEHHTHEHTGPPRRPRAAPGGRAHKHMNTTHMNTQAHLVDPELLREGGPAAVGQLRVPVEVEAAQEGHAGRPDLHT